MTSPERVVRKVESVEERRYPELFKVCVRVIRRLQAEQLAREGGAHGRPQVD